MQYILIFLASVSLAACGAETATSAATAAAVKKQEIEQGQKTLEQTKEKIGQSMELMQQGAQRAEEAAGK